MNSHSSQKFIRPVTVKINNIVGTGVIRKGNNIYNFAANQNSVYSYIKSIVRVDKNITINYIIAADYEFYISSSNTAGLIHKTSNLTVLHSYGAVGTYKQLTYDTINNTLIAISGADNKIHILNRNLNILNTIQKSLYYIKAIAIFGSKIFIGAANGDY